MGLQLALHCVRDVELQVRETFGCERIFVGGYVDYMRDAVNQAGNAHNDALAGYTMQ